MERSTLAAAFIGAGPPVMYYYYQQAVNQPFITTVEEGKIRYNKFFLFGGDQSDRNYIYPVIHTFVTLRNDGKATAYDCFARLNTELGSTYTRWGSLNLESFDLHPGEQQRLLLLRFFPQFTESIYSDLNNQINLTIPEKFWKIFGVLHEPNRENGVSSKELTGCEGFVIHPQRPRRKAVEERWFGEDQAIFWGAPYTTKEEYGQVKLEIGAENWSSEINLDDISIKDAVQKGFWQANANKEEFESLRDSLDEMGWKNIGS